MNKENTDLVKSILNRTFFTAWKNQKYKEDEYKYGNYSGLEIQLNAVCDLKCKYCYYTNHGKDLYPAKIAKPDLVLKNLDILLDWLSENKYYPKFELFSGEPFSQPIGFEALEKLIDWHIKENIESYTVIPTNFNFLFSDDKTKEVERLLSKGRENGFDILLSISMDGKYCDVNRPFKDSNKTRTDEYYDKVFEFAKKWGCAFHPMIYSGNIEKWIDNFLWFQENFEKYGIPWTSIYLLEVRNVEWNKDQIKEFYKFIRFVVRWVYHKSSVSPANFPKFVFDNKMMNLFSMFSQTGRGIGCSIQSGIELRLGDMSVNLCHRSAYDGLNLFKFIVEDDKIVDIESLNYHMMVAMYSADNNNFPWCENCTIRDLCSGQCLGAMYETNGDPFIPIPTVCALAHAKVAAILDELWDLGLFQYFYDFTNKKKSIKLYMKYFKGENQWN